ncbi:LEAF RUST 10 DISEASE-RESISTANCE LOCUS RECEPTOR-LIKE PROTEIN KINASE-like 2.7, partial [Thalictrum thalictroides]
AFDCGNIRKISYPFWKSGRVEYCGHPDFELKCQDDDSAEIQFESVTYRVLRIDKSNRKLQLATTVSWNDNCPSTFDNISFPSNDWSYLDSLSVNVTLFYGCPFIPQLETIYKFVCSDNNTAESYYWVDSNVLPTPPELSRCNVIVKVNALQGLIGSQLNTEEILKIGFSVEYAVNAPFCNHCEVSGGVCGYDRNTSQPKCFCFDGPQDGRCPRLRPSNSNSKCNLFFLYLST